MIVNPIGSMVLTNGEAIRIPEFHHWETPSTSIRIHHQDEYRNQLLTSLLYAEQLPEVARERLEPLLEARGSVAIGRANFMGSSTVVFQMVSWEFKMV